MLHLLGPGVRSGQWPGLPLPRILIIGVKVPNCVKNWERDVGQNIPFDKVFASMGTPLSDATEERQWRKLIHRATFVRNRKHKQAPQN
eukprot:7020967-Prymnesium_polylepis.1